MTSRAAIARRRRLMAYGRHQHNYVLKMKERVLTIHHLSGVRNAVHDARLEWYNIGLELNIDEEDLKCIQRENQNVHKECLREMLTTWLKRVDPKPTWRGLINALRSPSVGKEVLADTLAEKHCPSAKRRHRRISAVQHAKETSYGQRMICLFKDCIWEYKKLLVSMALVLLGCTISYYCLSATDSFHEALPQHFNHWQNPPPGVKLSKTLPRYNRVFCGRELELKNLTALINPMSHTKIISITGPPGFGKSTLAIHAGYEAEKAGFAVVYVDLSESYSMFEVRLKILNSVNLEEKSAFKTITDWILSINRVNIILILDNSDAPLHDNQQEFQSLLIDMYSRSGFLKIIVTTKHETKFLDPSEHVRITELGTEDAIKVLMHISRQINEAFARKLAKKVGNVPLALQIMGTLLKDEANSKEKIYSDLKKNLIETLSPEDLRAEERLKTTLTVSYKYLPKPVKSFGRIISNFPGAFTLDVAHYVSVNLNSVCSLQASKYHPKMTTADCLNHLVKRSLLNFNQVDEMYKFHHLVKEFFQYVQKERSRKAPHMAIVEMLSFELIAQEYYSQKFTNFIYAVQYNSPDTDDFYSSMSKEKTNYEHFMPNHVVADTVRIRPYTKIPTQVLLMTKYGPDDTFETVYSQTVLMLASQEVFQSKHVETYGNVQFFKMYVDHLINLSIMKRIKHNCSDGLESLLEKFGNVTYLHYQASKNNSIESHGILADYYAALAIKYRQLNNFESFMECWQKILYLRIFKSKCENRVNRCTTIQRGLAAFGRHKYRQAINCLRDHLYSRKLPVYRRARLFVIVYYSYIKLGRPDIAERLLTHDLTLGVVFDLNEYINPRLNTNSEVIEFGTNWQIMPHQTSITLELLQLRLDMSDEGFINSEKNCRTLMIFGAFLKEQAKEKEQKLLGIQLQKKVTLFVGLFTHITLLKTRLRLENRMLINSLFIH